MKDLNSQNVPTPLRIALWDAYDRKCAYTGKEIIWDALHIDHIVNKELIGGKKQVKRETELSKLGLPLDFNLCGVKNLAPTLSSVNLSKNHRDVPTNKKLEVLSKAADMFEQVMDAWERNEIETKIQKFIEGVSRHSTDGDKEILAEKFYRKMTENPAVFEVGKSVGRELLHITKPNVHIMGFAPTFPDYSGSIGISFNVLRLSAPTLTFGHQEIMEVLFSGLKTTPKLKARKFIVVFDKVEDRYSVQLGNARFFLPSEVCLELCSAIDEVAEIFLPILQRCETEIYKTIEFEQSRKNEVRLIKIPMWVWRKIAAFVGSHDYQSGDSPWHIFDPNPHFVKVFAFDQIEQKKDYRVFIYPRADRSFSRSFESNPPGDLWLCWNTLFADCLGRGEMSFKAGTVWDAEKTYQWLITEFLPKVLEKPESANHLRRLFGTSKQRQISSDDCRETFKKSVGSKICLNLPANVSLLKEDLQSIQSLIETERLVPPSAVIDVIEGIKSQISSVKSLSFRKASETRNEPESVINDSSEAIRENDSKEVINYKIKFLLKSLDKEINGLPIYEHENFLTIITPSLRALYEWHNQQILIKRHSLKNETSC